MRGTLLLVVLLGLVRPAAGQGVDPDDPAVREIAVATLRAMRGEVGLP